jgi:hypothetical protein
MPRGRQYYDPIVQVPGTVEGENDLARVEVFQDETLKWWGRQVASDGSLTGNMVGDFDHATLLKRVHESWPTHPVYELRSEGEDSTWEGHGPSPRLWQQAIENRQDLSDAGRAITFLPDSSPETGLLGSPPVDLQSGPSPDADTSGAGDEPIPPAVQSDEAPLRIIPITEPGIYVRLEDICGLLEMWAVAYEVDKNPSGALALREAVDALRDIG